MMSNNNFGILLYGPRYAGTTSFVSVIQHVCVIDVSQEGFRTWESFQHIIKDFEKATLFDNPIAIDKVSDLAELCVAYVCEKNDVDNPSERGIWAKVKLEMSEWLYRFADLPCQKWYVAGCKQETIETSLYSGTFISPNLSWPLNDIMEHITKQTLYLGPKQKVKKEINKKTGEIRLKKYDARIIKACATCDIMSGDNLGLLPEEFDAGKSGKEAYNNYLKEMKENHGNS